MIGHPYFTGTTQEVALNEMDWEHFQATFKKLKLMADKETDDDKRKTISFKIAELLGYYFSQPKVVAEKQEWLNKRNKMHEDYNRSTRKVLKK